MKRLGIWQDGSPEWHAARATRIGGSDIGTVCGWNQWETREELLARKRGELAPRPATDATDRGHYLEDAVARWLADKNNLHYDTIRSDATYVHDDEDWMLYNPDRIAHGDELVEIKTAAEKTAERGWGRQGTDQIPLCYQAQVTWGMHVLGLTVCHVGVLFGSPFTFARYRVRYDPEVAAYLIEQGLHFMHDLTEQEQAA